MIRHSKNKNVGILFETLIKSVTQSVTNGDNKRASRLFYLIKKHFMNESEIKKALGIYNQLRTNSSRNELYAFEMLDYLLKEYRDKIKEDVLKKEISSLIEGIDRCDNSKEVLSTKIKNYKLYASFYSLIEQRKELSSQDFMHCKEIIAEHFVDKNKIQIAETKIDLESENMKKLAIIIAIKNFKNKYKDLNEEQKEALTKYFTSSDKVFCNWVRRKTASFKKLCEEKKSKIKIENTRFKLDTLSERLDSVGKGRKITSQQFEDLLMCYELKENLKLL